MEWTPKYISWSIDGHEVRHVRAEDNPAVEHMAKEQSLRMNFWTPTFHSWGQGFDAADMPWFLLYDFVEVHKYHPESDEFELHWRDDFDSFDEKRWHKASGGFDANSSVFHPENVSVKAGNLVLKMEPDEATVHEQLHHGRAIEHHLARAHHFGDDVERHNLHRAEHFDREHVRSHRQSHGDERFWLEHGDPAPYEADDIDEELHGHSHDHELAEVDSSDSDAD